MVMHKVLRVVNIANGSPVISYIRQFPTPRNRTQASQLATDIPHSTAKCEPVVLSESPPLSLGSNLSEYLNLYLSGLRKFPTCRSAGPAVGHCYPLLFSWPTDSSFSAGLLWLNGIQLKRRMKPRSSYCAIMGHVFPKHPTL